MDQLEDDYLLIVERKQAAIAENLPQPLKQKKFGTWSNPCPLLKFYFDQLLWLNLGNKFQYFYENNIDFIIIYRNYC